MSAGTVPSMALLASQEQPSGRSTRLSPPCRAAGSGVPGSAKCARRSPLPSMRTGIWWSRPAPEPASRWLNRPRADCGERQEGCRRHGHKGPPGPACQQDLPQLAQALGKPLRFAVLKGRSNYICLKKLGDLSSAASSEQGRLIEARSAEEAGRIREEVARLADWAAETPERANRAGLDFEPSPRAWEGVSVSGRECPGANNCPSGRSARPMRGHERCSDVDVLVVNTHLYCLHVFTDAEILPAHDACVRNSRTAGEVDGAGNMLRAALRSYRDTLLSPVPDELVDLAVLCRGRLDAADAEVREAPGDETRQRMPGMTPIAGLAPQRPRSGIEPLRSRGRGKLMLPVRATEEESCLFATMGMWQGVDVPGRSLSLVVVDRIPFPAREAD
ncbi:Probable ATP-dependent helicase DinG homolog [Geodia barretti]|uniref:Probable ATP-dependent helicase DinG homolog n=1 Tax=Geodia barretti TaxID=519541 RepID=A0AA35T793_GEOBA|nr:Probable ATP-dependent helicase DinG homolog [Geodia barretti]